MQSYVKFVLNLKVKILRDSASTIVFLFILFTEQPPFYNAKINIQTFYWKFGISE